MIDKKVCPVTPLQAQSVKIFVPGDGERANQIATKLAKRYDIVAVMPQHCDQDSAKCGSEILVIRRKEAEGSEQEFKALSEVLDVIIPTDKKNRPSLQNMSDDMLLYKADCN